MVFIEFINLFIWRNGHHSRARNQNEYSVFATFHLEIAYYEGPIKGTICKGTHKGQVQGEGGLYLLAENCKVLEKHIITKKVVVAIFAQCHYLILYKYIPLI